MRRHNHISALVTLALATLSAVPASAAPPAAPPEQVVASGTFTNSTPVAIPSVLPTYTPLTSTIAVTGLQSYLANITAQTFLSHSWPNDLDVTLTSPAGTIVTLTTDNGGGNADVFNGTVWDDTADPASPVPYLSAPGMVTDHQYSPGVVASPLTPEEPLGAFHGENPNGTWTLTVVDDLAGNGGSLNSWSLTIAAQGLPSATSTVDVSNTTAAPIPDGGSVASTIAVGGQPTYLCDVQVTTNIVHPSSGQLQVALTSPAGTVVTLTSNNGAADADVFNGTVWDDRADPGGQASVAPDTSSHLVTDATLKSGTTATRLVPEEPLDAFTGQNPNGTWTLTAADVAAGSAGTLVQWSLHLTTCTFADVLHGVTPARLLDTRAGQSTIDGQFAGTGPIGQGATLDLTVAGRGGVPSTGAGAVAVNVTAADPTAASFLTIFPTGSTRPLASNLNVVAGQTVPNMAVVPIGANGKVTIYNDGGSTHVVVDVLGWFPIGASFTGLSPARVADTRATGTTVDGVAQRGGALAAGGVLTVPVAGRGGVPASGAGAVAINLTATQPTASTYLTAYPSGTTRPNASNLNAGKGATVPNMAIVPLGADGSISVFNFAGSTHVIVDVLGWFPSAPTFTGLSPARLADTRAGTTTVDGQFAGGGALGPGATLDLVVAGRGGVPATGAGTVALNVTITAPTAPTFLSVYPTGAMQPNASNLNATAGLTVANMVIVPVGAGGKVTLFNNSGNAHVVVDVEGWFPAVTT